MLTGVHAGGAAQVLLEPPDPATALTRKITGLSPPSKLTVSLNEIVLLQGTFGPIPKENGALDLSMLLPAGMLIVDIEPVLIVTPSVNEVRTAFTFAASAK